MRFVTEPTEVNTVSKSTVSVENSNFASGLLVTSKSDLHDCRITIINTRKANRFLFFIGNEVNEILYLRIYLLFELNILIMKNIYASLLLMLIIFSTQNSTANCPANSAPTNISASSVCKTGYSIFTANLNDVTNSLVWLDSANRVIGIGNNFQKYIDKAGLSFRSAEVGYDGITSNVGALPNAFTSTYPSQNFTNGQYFTCATTVRIDSIVLRTNNAVNGNIQIWSKAPENGGYVLQKIPFRSEEHTSELQSHHELVCRLLLEKNKPQQPNGGEGSVGWANPVKRLRTDAG